MHRWDAESAHRDAHGIDLDVALDGIDEMVHVIGPAHTKPDFPTGTIVELSTGETALVVQTPDNPSLYSQPRVRVLFVNIFAGITDLGEFSRLLLEAFARTPKLKIPIVARLVGTNFETARDYLATNGVPVSTDLGDAVANVRRHLA